MTKKYNDENKTEILGKNWPQGLRFDLLVFELAATLESKTTCNLKELKFSKVINQ